MPKVPGLVKGLGVTLGTLFNTATKGSNTVQYPHEKETPPIRSRGVIACPLYTSYSAAEKKGGRLQGGR